MCEREEGGVYWWGRKNVEKLVNLRLEIVFEV